MVPPFEEQLDDLIARNVDIFTRDEIISALELKLMALREEEVAAAAEE